MIPYDPLLAALVGAACGVTALAGFLLGDLHGEVRVLRRVLADRIQKPP